MLLIVDANVVFSALMRRGKPLKVFSFIKKELELIPLETFEDKVEEAKEKSPHLKDMAYVALSLKFDCKILSGDKGLKECLPDRVITPSEAIEILFGRTAP